MHYNHSHPSWDGKKNEQFGRETIHYTCSYISWTMGHCSNLHTPFSGPSVSPLGGRKVVEVDSCVWVEVSAGGPGPPTCWGGEWD